MFKFSLKDFRGFHSLNFVDIRPITLLIGENSAGKSSFLAALKFMYDLASGDEPSFNRDPFQLGTFQQISHYRGGKAGRARSFQLMVEGLSETGHSNRRASRQTEAVSRLIVHFENNESQAVVSKLEVTSEGDTLTSKFEGEKLNLELQTAGKSYQIETGRFVPRLPRSEIARYWTFILREAKYMLAGGANQSPDMPPEIRVKVERLSSLGSALLIRIATRVDATSAIRTKPLRTYTPGLEAKDGEGSHVPFEMAKLYRAKNRDQWKALKADLGRFGSASEMFREVDIKSFGSSISDPFQIQLSLDGPKTNLVDLGYGTSQILPILYLISTSPPGATFLIQQPEVHLHPKAQAALGTFFVETRISHRRVFILETHSDFIVDRIRRAVATGRIPPSDVSLLFFEKKKLESEITQIELGSDGAPIDPPSTYRDFFIDEQMRVLGIE